MRSSQFSWLRLTPHKECAIMPIPWIALPRNSPPVHDFSAPLSPAVNQELLCRNPSRTEYFICIAAPWHTRPRRKTRIHSCRSPQSLRPALNAQAALPAQSTFAWCNDFNITAQAIRRHNCLRQSVNFHVIACQLIINGLEGCRACSPSELWWW